MGPSDTPFEWHTTDCVKHKRQGSALCKVTCSRIRKLLNKNFNRRGE